MRAYHHWSLLDNFERAESFAQRFGLVYVDSRDQRRIIKDSGQWYGRRKPDLEQTHFDGRSGRTDDEFTLNSGA